MSWRSLVCMFRVWVEVGVVTELSQRQNLTGPSGLLAIATRKREPRIRGDKEMGLRMKGVHAFRSV